MNRETGLQDLIGKLPEQEMWRALQDMTAAETEVDDRTIGLLDSRMQGFLFLQEYINNRKARIAFARSSEHMTYLRDAAGSRNVWMDDAEFSELVEQDDAATLACFARSEQMNPHHLMYIEYKLALNPHGKDTLATSYDAMITSKKVLEQRGMTRSMALIRLAKAALEGSAGLETELANRLRSSVFNPENGPRALWHAYLNLRSLDSDTLKGLLAAAGESSGGPTRSSGQPGRSLH